MADHGILISSLDKIESLKNDSTFLVSHRGDGLDVSYLSKGIRYDDLSTNLSIDLDLYGIEQSIYQEVKDRISTYFELSSQSEKTKISVLNSLSSFDSRVSSVEDKFKSSDDLLKMVGEISAIVNYGKDDDTSITDTIDDIKEKIGGKDTGLEDRVTKNTADIKTNAESITTINDSIEDINDSIEDLKSFIGDEDDGDGTGSETGIAGRITSLENDYVSKKSDNELSGDNTFKGEISLYECGSITHHNTEENTKITIETTRKVGTSSKTSNVDIVVDNDGKGYVIVPEVNPTDGTTYKDTNYSATTKWASDSSKADDSINNLVHKIGTEKITGSKTFSELSVVSLKSKRIDDIESLETSITDYLSGTVESSVDSRIEALSNDVKTNKTDISDLSGDISTLTTGFGKQISTDNVGLKFDNDSNILSLTNKDQTTDYASVDMSDLDCIIEKVYLSSGIADHDSHESGFDKYVVIHYRNDKKDDDILCLSNLYTASGNVKIDNWDISLSGNVGSSSKPVYLKNGVLTEVDELSLAKADEKDGSGKVTNLGNDGLMSKEDKERLDKLWSMLSGFTAEQFEGITDLIKRGVVALEANSESETTE